MDDGALHLSMLFPEDLAEDSDKSSVMKVNDKEEASLTDKESNFVKLKEMFTNIDENYIRQICTDPPISGSEENIFVLLVNHLLIYNEKVDESLIDETLSEDYQLSKKLEAKELAALQEHFEEEARNEQLFRKWIEQAEQENFNKEASNHFLTIEEISINDKMEIIENILPDADPEELKKVIKERNNDPEFIQEFIESKLVDKNYGKRDEYYAKLRSKAMIEQYTSKFVVKSFIKQFPDPINYFENPKRQCIFQKSVFNYLKKIFCTFDSQYLNKMYLHFNFNLSLTVNFIRSRGYEPNVGLDHGIEDIPLLKEIAYIENKLQIQQYLKAVKLKEERELEYLRTKKLLLECQCCYDEVKPYECIECKNGHFFCKSCIIRGTDVIISNGEGTVRCFKGCDSEIGLEILRMVLSEHTFEKFLKKRQDIEITAAKISDLANCPFCPYAMELGPEIKIFMCKNPECKKISCRKCKKLNHLPIKCEDVLDEHKGRLFVEEEMSKGLIMNCYKCQKPFIKENGCNSMKCKFCGTKWCYICKQPIENYTHFEHSPSCKVNVNSKLFDQQQVNLKRSQAIQQIRKDYPDLNLPDV